MTLPQKERDGMNGARSAEDKCHFSHAGDRDS